jgi:hypothetical protein
VSDKPSLFAELKQRNVYKVVAAYAVVAWLLIQAASIILPTFEAPAWTMKVLIAILAIGFPIAVVLAWAFEITPEGIKRESEVLPNESITAHTGRKLIGITIALAVIAVGLFAFQLLRPKPLAKALPSPAASSAPLTTQIPAKSIAVLPFDNLSRDPDNAYFAEGVQDEILTQLAKVADLQSPAFQGFAKRIGLVDYWKKNRWPDLCSPTPENGPDTFTCR